MADKRVHSLHVRIDESEKEHLDEVLAFMTKSNPGASLATPDAVRHLLHIGFKAWKSARKAKGVT